MASRTTDGGIQADPLDGYKREKLLGKGGFGEVWRAVRTADRKKVALKIINLSSNASAHKELRALKLCTNLNHPNVVSIIESWLTDTDGRCILLRDAVGRGDRRLQELYIVMTLGEMSLEARLDQVLQGADQPRGLPLDELMEYMLGAAKGIDFLNKPDHGLDDGDGPIVHCDIKPANMLIVGGGLQIADCGVAVALNAGGQSTNNAFSARYAAPELINSKPVPRTDQYSLAISYFQLRTGRLPFPADASAMAVMMAHATGGLNFGGPPLTAGERKVLKFATSPQTEDRYWTCLDMVKQLEKAAAGGTPLPPRPLTSSNPEIGRGGPVGRLTPRPGDGYGATSEHTPASFPELALHLDGVTGVRADTDPVEPPPAATPRPPIVGLEGTSTASQLVPIPPPAGAAPRPGSDPDLDRPRLPIEAGDAVGVSYDAPELGPELRDIIRGNSGSHPPAAADLPAARVRPTPPRPVRPPQPAAPPAAVPLTPAPPPPAGGRPICHPSARGVVRPARHDHVGRPGQAGRRLEGGRYHRPAGQAEVEYRPDRRRRRAGGRRRRRGRRVRRHPQADWVGRVERGRQADRREVGSRES